MYGVSGEVCWRVGKECGEGNGEDVGKCVEVWGPNTLLIPHISLPSPFPTSPLTSPTTHHTFLHLLSYLFPHPSFLPPHPNTFSYPHISLHLLKVWRSYHVTKFLWRSYCGEVTMWRSYWKPFQLPCIIVGLKVPCSSLCCFQQPVPCSNYKSTLKFLVVFSSIL